jgi:regulator of protease activity HflC (stomatin/prohibitin superfamily)
MKVCWPVWRTVSALVSKQVVTYNANAKRCPTRDNIFVDIDLSINFRIGPDIQRVEDFFFKMGPARLDAYLAFEVEESIRHLVNGVKYVKVNDLRSDFATDMLQTLQSKVGAFGVDLMNVKITDVHLPEELQTRLEKTTSFSTKISEEAKTHTFTLQQLHNDHSQKMAAIEQNTAIERQVRWPMKTLSL